MAGPLRRDAPPRDPEYPHAAVPIEREFRHVANPNGEHLLPGRVPNDQLNRSAASVGRNLGVAVSAMSHLSRDVRGTAERLRGAGEAARRNILAASADVIDNAAARVQRARNAANLRSSRLGSTASRRVADGADVANRRLSEIEQAAVVRWNRARNHAGRRLVAARYQLQNLQAESPLKAIAVCASAAFVLGVAIRIWRSGND